MTTIIRSIKHRKVIVMNKNIYSKPVTEVINIETAKILCGSDPWDYDGLFSQVPGPIPSTGNRLV